MSFVTSYKKKALLWMLLLLIVASLGGNINQTIEHHLYTIGSLVSYIYCLVVWRRSGHQFFSIYTVFVLYMLMSHIGQSLLFVFNFPADLLDLYRLFSMEEMNAYLKYHMLCSGGMLLGTALYFAKLGTPISLKDRSVSIKAQNGQLNGKYDWLLLVCCLYVLYRAVHFVVIRQSMDYADFFEQRSAKTILTSIPGYVATILGLLYAYKNRYRKLIYAFWITCSFLYMIGGSRGSAISYIANLVLIVPLTHDYLFTKRRNIYWLILAIVGFSFLSVISSNRSSALSSSALHTDNDILFNAAGSMIEIGSSAKTAIISMGAIEAGNIPHYQTNLYFILASIFPASIVSAIGLPDIMLDQWVTEYYTGSLVSGLGYSCVAESYVNYGWFGWLWFVLYAIFISFAETSIHRKWSEGEFFVPALLAIFLGRAVFYAREQIYFCQSTARFIIYAYIIFVLFFSNRAPHNVAGSKKVY